MARHRFTRRLPRGFSVCRDTIIRRNLSFVLHEHSESVTVREAALKCQIHALSLQTATPTVVWTLDGKFGSADRMSHLRSGQIDYAISVQVGLPHLLEYAIAELGLQCPVILCDVPDLTNETYYLFEAPATLSFPAAISGRALVSALVLRPGKKGAHLALSRVFQLPDDIEVVIHEIEGILRRHVDQWISQHQLWSGPAEQLLPDEVYSSDSVSRGNSDASLTTY